MEIKLTAEELVKMLGWDAKQIIKYLQKKFNSENNLLSQNENNTFVVSTCDKSKGFVKAPADRGDLNKDNFFINLCDKWNWNHLTIEEKIIFWNETKKAFPQVNHKHELQLIDAWHERQKAFFTGKGWHGEYATGGLHGGIRKWFAVIASYKNPYRKHVPHQLKKWFKTQQMPKPKPYEPTNLYAVKSDEYRRLIELAPKGVKELHCLYTQLDYSFIKIANLDIPKVALSSYDIQFIKENADLYAGIAIMLDRHKATA